jgi:hypothetical protein
MSDSILSLTGSDRAPKIAAACCASASESSLSLRGLQQLTVESSRSPMGIERGMDEL